MPQYSLHEGFEHEEDNSVSAGPALSPIDNSSSYFFAEWRLLQLVRKRGNDFETTNLGMFRHLPGVEGCYRETYRENGEKKSRVWLIKKLTS